MTKLKNRKFQSSREVFEEYIPGYKEKCELGHYGNGKEPFENGVLLAESLINQLKSAVAKTHN